VLKRYTRAVVYFSRHISVTLCLIKYYFIGYISLNILFGKRILSVVLTALKNLSSSREQIKVISLMENMARNLRSFQNAKHGCWFASFLAIRAYSFSFPRSFNLFVH